MKFVHAAAITCVLAAIAGCSSSELSAAPGGLDPARVRSFRGHGFVVYDDGSLEPQEESALFQELAEARPKVLALLKTAVAPGDFRTWEQRHAAACAASEAAPLGDIRVVIQRSGGRCHADENGLTLLKA